MHSALLSDIQKHEASEVNHGTVRITGNRRRLVCAQPLDFAPLWGPDLTGRQLQPSGAEGLKPRTSADRRTKIKRGDHQIAPLYLLTVHRVSAQIGGTARTGQRTGGWHPVAAGRTVEPVAAMLALGLGQALEFLAFGTLPNHFALTEVVAENQPATGAIRGIAFGDGGTAGWQRTAEHRLATAAPGFVFFQLFADRAFFHGRPRCLGKMGRVHRQPSGQP